MACQKIPIPGGYAIVCGRRRRAKPCATPDCGRPSVALCDWPVIRKGHQTTCSAPLCDRCRHPVKDHPDTDWCPPHLRAATTAYRQGRFAWRQGLPTISEEDPPCPDRKS